MTIESFNQSVTREIQRIMRDAQRQLEDRKPEIDWPAVEEYYWRLLEDGRSDGQGESFAERNA